MSDLYLSILPYYGRRGWGTEYMIPGCYLVGTSAIWVGLLLYSDRGRVMTTTNSSPFCSATDDS